MLDQQALRDIGHGLVHDLGRQRPVKWCLIPSFQGPFVVVETTKSMHDNCHGVQEASSRSA
jgi:hypothetical protein